MKIRFSNLGTIRKTEIDLRPMTVIVGPNNSSKTFLAYSIYGLLRELRQMDPELSGTLAAQLAQKKRSASWRSQRLADAVHTHVESSTRRFEAGLGTFFQDSSDKLFRRTRFHIDWQPDPQRMRASLQLDPDAPSPDAPSPDVDRLVRDSLELTTPFILPAERNALIITAASPFLILGLIEGRGRNTAIAIAAAVLIPVIAVLIVRGVDAGLLSLAATALLIGILRVFRRSG